MEATHTYHSLNPHTHARSDDINIVVAMKAMGADSDQEVVALVGQEEALQALLLPSLQVREGGGSGVTRRNLDLPVIVAE